MARIEWTQPKAQRGAWVIFIDQHGNRREGQVDELFTHYPNGRAEHVYRVLPTDKKNRIRVPEGMILTIGERGAYQRITYRPTRTTSDSRTDAYRKRAQVSVSKGNYGSGGRDRTYDQLINSQQ